MYNLIVGFVDEQVLASRLFAYTEPSALSYVAPDEKPDLQRLQSLPTLVMPELQDGTSAQKARVGHIENLAKTGKIYRFRFVPNTDIPPIDSSRIEDAAAYLQVESDWEFNHSHWAVKEADLYRVLSHHVAPSRPSLTRAFSLPTEASVENDLVAVMMPFDAKFNAVYTALRQAVAREGLRCQRADDIWINTHIIDDVASLLWRARVVIADFTSRNPNVFYETGIAHALNRDVLPIAQTMQDVPFDLQAIRTLTYLPNDQGLRALQAGVAARLRHLIGADG